jgi:hypothetical protein
VKVARAGVFSSKRGVCIGSKTQSYRLKLVHFMSMFEYDRMNEKMVSKKAREKASHGPVVSLQSSIPAVSPILLDES